MNIRLIQGKQIDLDQADGRKTENEICNILWNATKGKLGVADLVNIIGEDFSCAAAHEMV